MDRALKADHSLSILHSLYFGQFINFGTVRSEGLKVVLKYHGFRFPGSKCNILNSGVTQSLKAFNGEKMEFLRNIAYVRVSKAE